jgi:hypothetical protein
MGNAMTDLHDLTESKAFEALKTLSSEEQLRSLEILRGSPKLQSIYLDFVKYHSFKFDNYDQLKNKIDENIKNIIDLPELEKNIILTLLSYEMQKFHNSLYHKLLDFVDSAYTKNFSLTFGAEISEAIEELNEVLQEGDMNLDQLLEENNAARVYNNAPCNNKFDEMLEQLRQDLHIKWEPLKESLHIKNTTGYYGQAWVNHSLKQIIIANAGTKYDYPTQGNYRFKTFHWFKDLIKDVLNDFLVYMEMVPFQFERGATKFIDSVIEELSKDKDLSNYSVCFVGHSLGGILSDLSVAYLLNQHPNKFRDVKSVSFDNPGSKPIVGKYLEKLMGKIGGLQVNLEKMKDYCIIFNHLPNWMNAVNEQIGNVIHIKSNSHEHQHNNWFEKFTIIKDIIKNFADHDKSNFRKAEIFEKVVHWEKGLFTQYIKHPVDVSISGLKALKSSLSSNFYNGISVSYSTANEVYAHSKTSLNQNIPYYTNSISNNISGCSQVISSKLLQSISSLYSGINSSYCKASELVQNSKETICQNIPYYAESIKNNITGYKDIVLEEFGYLKQGMGQFMILGGVDALYGDERDH